MTNKECREHLEKVKTMVPDNGERKSDRWVPCAISFYNWGEEEIDGQPKDFDWKKFWSDCKELYPLHSIAGGNSFDTETGIKNLEYRQVPLPYLLTLVKKGDKKNVLEIGYGFGGAARRFKEGGYNYYGIDYLSSGTPDKKYGKFIEIDKSGIPEEIAKTPGGFDIVYSENVFQHLTNKQRDEYFEQSYKILNTGGIMYVSMFTRNERGIKIANELYGKRNYATNFFGIHTRIPNANKMKRQLGKIGFNVVEINHRPTVDMRTNWTTLTLRKND